MKEMTLKEKSVYGNIWIYPVCEQALLFARLIQKKTFTSQDITIIEQLGYKVNIQSL